MPAYLGGRMLAVGRLGDDGVVGFALKQGTQAAAHHALVVGNQDADQRSGPSRNRPPRRQKTVDTLRQVMAEMRLPSDLLEFLEVGRSLEYDPSEAEPGMLTLRRPQDLALGQIYSSSSEEGHPLGQNEEPGAGEDPHLDDEKQGYYVILAVDLVASCTGDYSPEGKLAWIPDQGTYATWDDSHLDILVFPGVSWSGIAASPLRYVNAQWSHDPPGYYLAPWLHGYEYRVGSPWN